MVYIQQSHSSPAILQALLRKGQLLPQQPRFPLPVEVDFLKVDVDGCDAWRIEF